MGTTRRNLPYFVYKIGVELEGAFKQDREFKNASFKYDGSVHFEYGQLDGDYIDDDWEEPDRSSILVGEYIVRRPLKTWQGYRNWCKHNFPDEVNSSCGTHVHISTKNLIYMSGLIEKADMICDSMHKAYKRWAKTCLPHDLRYIFEERLAGDNEYCRKGHNAHQLLSNARSSDCRYKWLNFSSLSAHGTVENRLLPAFEDPQQLLDATSIMLNIYTKALNEYLKSGKDLVAKTIELGTAKGSLSPSNKVIDIMTDRDVPRHCNEGVSYVGPNNYNIYVAGNQTRIGGYTIPQEGLVQSVATSAARKGKKVRG